MAATRRRRRPGRAGSAGLVQVAALGQQLGQLPGGIPVAGVGPGAQLVQVPAVGQQPGQLHGGVPVAGVGPGAQLVQVPAPGQQIGQPHGGVPVAGVGGAAVQRDGVAVQQPAMGAAGEAGGVGGVAEVAEAGRPRCWRAPGPGGVPGWRAGAGSPPRCTR